MKNDEIESDFEIIAGDSVVFLISKFRLRLQKSKSTSKLNYSRPKLVVLLGNVLLELFTTFGEQTRIEIITTADTKSLLPSENLKIDEIESDFENAVDAI